MGDEHHSHALLAHLVDGRQHIGGLPHTQRRGRFVEDQHPGAEIHRARDCYGLAFATRKRPHRLIRPAQIDAHLAPFAYGDLIGQIMVEELERPPPRQGLVAHEKVAADRHQRDHRKILIHSGDAGIDGVAWRGEAHRRTIEQDLALGWLVHSRHGLDEGRLAGPIVPKQAMTFAGHHLKRNPGQSDNLAKVLLDILHLDNGFGHPSAPR